MSFNHALVVLCMLSYLMCNITASPRVFLEECERTCLTTKDSCSAVCQKKSARRRSFRLERCQDKCSSRYRDCTGQCACSLKCRREFRGCKEGCESHPFDSKWDKKQCIKECRFEDVQCKHECWENKIGVSGYRREVTLQR